MLKEKKHTCFVYIPSLTVCSLGPGSMPHSFFHPQWLACCLTQRTSKTISSWVAAITRSSNANSDLFSFFDWNTMSNTVRGPPKSFCSFLMLYFGNSATVQTTSFTLNDLKFVILSITILGKRNFNLYLLDIFTWVFWWNFKMMPFKFIIS